MKSNLKQKTWFKVTNILAAISIALVCVTFIPSSFFSIDSNLYAETLEEELERVKEERETTKKQIEQAKKAEADYVNQVNQTEGNLVAALSELDSLNTKLSGLKSDIDRLTVDLVIKESELSDIEKTLDEKTLILNKRVASIYKNRERDVLQLLFETENFSEFFSSLKLMNLIAVQDFEILKDVQEIRDTTIDVKENISDLKDQKKERKKDLETLVSDAEQKKREIEGIYYEKKNLLSKTRANKEALIKMEDELAGKEKEITKKLEALRYGNAPGRLIFVTKGILTSGFGYRISPLSGAKQFHGGVDIGAAHGTPVTAAAAGEVLQAEYMGGYGYAILVYHGGGFATFYAHLSGFAVSAGQKVNQGQTIGYVGSTGYSTGPHLHFEVRINGIQQNPYSYF